MDVIEAIKTRRSIRKFDTNNYVSDDLIKKIIECAGWAPSAHNQQPWHFIVFRDSNRKIKIAERSKWAKFFEHAPVGIVVLTDFSLARESKGDKLLKYYCLQDSAAAVENLLLSAWNYNLGTCWIGDFDEEQLYDLFNISKNWVPVGIIAMGYPDQQWSGKASPRRNVEEIVDFVE
ncbi:nitroreductase family protein [Alkalibaculum sp. M08DMB]|uniref:Nitroreductase family protein n=1 Tax=Alkalibaculum sporogenes TaxID=2655001 RepID=A0A6A7KAF4_9FIRM|nr:nitroreductase family protein [Alkalibaculum sporogenes]MPW26488.1 nitroreductase family protein [Alkalibaculum sporogenes]